LHAFQTYFFIVFVFSKNTFLKNPLEEERTIKTTTQENLISAFAGESQAHMRYLYFAGIADREGFPNVARLFNAVAYSEQNHAHKHFMNLKHLNSGFVSIAHAPFGPGNTSRALEHGIMGEEYEINEMYPVFLQVAEFQEEEGAQFTFNWALQSEKEHAKLYKKAKASIDKGNDAPFGSINVCERCGFTVDGDAPDVCPVCNAPKDEFKEF
jgi:rubrerythrin